MATRKLFNQDRPGPLPGIVSIMVLVSAATWSADGLAEAPHRRVLIVSVDGCRPDALQAASAPNIDALITEGAFSYLSQTGDVPISGPSYSNMFTGVWRDKHGVHDNDFDGANFDEYPIFFCRLKAWNPGMVTQSIVRWAPLDPNLIRCADYHSAPSSDSKATDEAVQLLRETDPDVLFLHLEDVDTAGHANSFSPTSAGYLAAIEKSDQRVGQVLGALDARPARSQEEWLIVVLSDHGGSGKDHHADVPENRTIFMVFHGTAVVPGEIQPPPFIVDIPATVMVYLGLAIDPAWGLDGQVVALRSEPPAPSRQLPSDCNSDGALDLSDVVCLLGHLFLGAAANFPCGGETLEGGNAVLMDSNGDGDVDVSDAVHVLLYLFAGGPPPALGAACVAMEGCLAVCPALP